MSSPVTLLGVIVTLALLPAASGATPAPGATVVFEGVTVLPMHTPQLLRDRTVIVEDGRISAVAAEWSGQLPDNALRVRGHGRFLMPGLAEMHAHVPGQIQGEAYRDRVLFLYVAAGVTTARGMLGEPSHLALRERLMQHQLIGPRLYTSGPSLNGNSVSGAAHGRRLVREQHAAGYDFLKIHPGLSLAEYQAIAETAAALDMPFAGHVPADVGLVRALAAGQATIDHLDGYVRALVPDAGAGGGFFGAGLADRADPSRTAALAAETLRAGVWNVPTQSLIEHRLAPLEQLMAFTELRYMPRNVVTGWERAIKRAGAIDAEAAHRFVVLRRSIIRALHDAGAGLLLGSDAPQVFNVPGFAAHRELQALVDAGLTPYEALVTATVNPARFLGTSDRFGSVRPGLEADLLLLDANPLEDIANIGSIAGVMVRGLWLSAETLRQRLEELAATR